MFIGFDYGTANCSVAIIDKGQPISLLLEQQSTLLPSMLSAPSREAVTEWLFRCQQVDFPEQEHQQALRRACAANELEDITVTTSSVQFGQAALGHYLSEPEEVWFVKSPKSFLGVSGLLPQQRLFFEDLVCAMMSTVRQRAEQQIDAIIDQTVIGRPINFQGMGGESANLQAESLLYRAAKRAGFSEIEFQFEPVAAGLDYEATLVRETCVMVVDIGGGTTDCSLLLMGPEWRHKRERKASLLAHSGCRVGGNDLDIMLAFKTLMPLLGCGGETLKGTALPSQPWWNAVAINDIPAQNAFYAQANRQQLQNLIRDASQPEIVKRLLQVWQHKLGYRLTRTAEESKIALSASASFIASLAFLEADLTTPISREQLEHAITTPLGQMMEQVELTLRQSATAPDVIYLTGGSARSPLIRQALTCVAPGIPVASGDDFSSVTAGLARWGALLFR